MPYVRVITGSVTKWTCEKPDIKARSRQAFPLAGEEISVYEFDNDVTEATCIVAHFTTRNPGHVEPCYGIRIEEADLDGLNSTVTASGGLTGHTLADTLHRNISIPGIGGWDTVTERIINAISAGSLRARTVMKRVVQLKLEEFLKLPTSEAEEHLKQRARRALRHK